MAIQPYLPKNPNDLIRSTDWNEIQIRGREDLEAHDHSGGDKGSQLDTSGIKDGAITQAKLSADIEIGGTLEDGSVTSGKLASPLSSVSTNNLSVRGVNIRPSFGEVDFEWSYLDDSVPVEPTINKLSGTLSDEAYQALTNASSDLSDPLVRALFRIIAGTIELHSSDPDQIKKAFERVGAGQARAYVERARSMFRSPRREGDPISEALRVLIDLWQRSVTLFNRDELHHPTLLIGLARQPEFTLSHITNGVQIATIPALVQHAGGSFEEVVAAGWHPIMSIGSTGDASSPPVFDLGEADPFQEATEFEIEVEAWSYTPVVGALGIGGIQVPPPLNSAKIYYRQNTPVEGLDMHSDLATSISIRRRIQLRPGQSRQFRLWASALVPHVLTPTGAKPVDEVELTPAPDRPTSPKDNAPPKKPGDIIITRPGDVIDPGTRIRDGSVLRRLGGANLGLSGEETTKIVSNLSPLTPTDHLAEWVTRTRELGLAKIIVPVKDTGKDIGKDTDRFEEAGATLQRVRVTARCRGGGTAWSKSLNLTPIEYRLDGGLPKFDRR